MVPRNDAEALAEELRGMLTSPERLGAASRRNYARALGVWG